VSPDPLLDHIEAVIWEADLHGEVRRVSAYAERLLGHPASTWLAPGFWQAQMHPADYEWVQRLRADAVRQGEAYRCDFRMRHENGTVVWVQERGRPVTPGTEARLRGFTTDIGDRKQVEAELLHSRKLETLGRLISGIAHDFTNLAMALTGYSDVVLLQLEEAHAARPFVEQLKATSEASVNLLRQLLAFSRKREVEPTFVSLNDKVAGMARLLRRVIGDNIRIETVLAPDLGLIRIDPGQVDQVLMNLAVNARDAMPDGGVLTMETGTVAARGDGEGRWVALRVRDTGTGMSEETRARIFEPFFTTKDPDRGTGLGLALVHEIVDRNGGRIHVDSVPGKGSLFEIFLPWLEGENGILPARDSQPLPLGTETILLVDDDETVRRLLAHGLEGLGYRVLQAPSGEMALAGAGSAGGGIDLIVTDLIMVDMTGVDLVRLLRAQRPEARALYITAYSGDAGKTRPPESEVLLEKPFRLDHLARQVRAVLDRK
jgi:two-component system, cell cycle sensor histidine kinase and response regulator CckA